MSTESDEESDFLNLKNLKNQILKKFEKSESEHLRKESDEDSDFQNLKKTEKSEIEKICKVQILKKSQKTESKKICKFQILKNLKNLNLISNLSTCVRKAAHASYSAAACAGAARAHARGGMRRGEKNER